MSKKSKRKGIGRTKRKDFYSSLTELQIKQTESQRLKFINQLKRDLLKLPEAIQEQINQIRELVLKFDPESVLMMVFGRHLANSLGKETESDFERVDNVKTWVKEYVFNILVSTPASNSKVRFDDDSANLLESGVDNLFK